MKSIKNKIETIEGSTNVKATFGKITKIFKNEEMATQWLLNEEGEYLINRQKPMNVTLSLEHIDDGIWDDYF
jgi:hypothetical protein